MKRYVIFGLLFLLIGVGVKAQDIPQSQVPSLVLNNFRSSFSDVKDIDWEKKGDLYKVEFETGFWNGDHTAWYNEEGDLIKHKEEIAKKELPESIREILQKDYRWYWVKDVEKLTEKDQVSYLVELKSFTEEWDIVFDESGEILSKVAD